MRKFNAFEKEVIKLISNIELESNESFSRFLQNNYFTAKRKQALIIKHDSKDVLFYMAPEIFDNESKRAKEIKNFWTLISLIEYLIEQRYVTNIPIQGRVGLDLMYEEFDGHIKSNGAKLILNSKGDYLLPSKPDLIFNVNEEVKMKGILWNDLYNNISNSLLGVLYPSEGIKYLVENKFRTAEEKRYYMQLKLTWLGIIISGCLGAYSIWSDILSSENTKLFKADIIEKTKSIHSETQKLNNNMIKRLDTIIREIKNSNKSNS